MNIYSLILSDGNLSTEAVLAITISVTFVLTALFTYILTSLYYRRLMTNDIIKFNAELKGIKDGLPACTNTIKMDANPTKADTSIN